VADQFILERAGLPPAPSAGTLARLNATGGVRGTAVIHLDATGTTIPATLIGRPGPIRPRRA
jgi:hypothetical protein